MPRTHYQTLGLSPNASTEQIRRAFRAAARTLHPDVSTATDAAQRFAEASHAYEVLSDPAARRDYDHSLAVPTAGADPASHAQPHYSWTNIATHASPDPAAAPPRSADLDEMYHAFFDPATRRGNRS